MSFSKAKIQRFNDVKIECTPSPAKHNAKEKSTKVVRTLLNVKKSGSPQSSEAGSVHSTPCFQTPTLPLKRKKLLGLSFKGTKTEGKCSEKEELKYRIVECNNKDLYIKDLVEQIEEMTGKLSSQKKDCEKVTDEKKRCEEELMALRKLYEEESRQRVEVCNIINNTLKEFTEEMKECGELKCENFEELSQLFTCIGQFAKLATKKAEESHQEKETMKIEYDEKLRLLREKEKQLKQSHLEDVEALTIASAEEKEQLLKKLDEREARVQLLEENLKQEVEGLKSAFLQEKQQLLNKLNDSEAKVQLLQENFKDINVLSELQIQEIENVWKEKIEATEKESEAILKECQAIGEYNIIQCEIEKNLIKNQLEEKQQAYDEVLQNNKKLQEEINTMKHEKHAYDISISMFEDTIEVLTKRLFNSDGDVEQLKEELEKTEEKILDYERKVFELTAQLNEAHQSNEEIEMQSESTLKIIQARAETIEKDLLRKVEDLRKKIPHHQYLEKLLAETMEQQHEQHVVIADARTLIADSTYVILALEETQAQLEEEVSRYKSQLEEEVEEAAEIRKKYIEKSGKYDELAHQFEQLLQELDASRAKAEELEGLAGSYRQQLEDLQLAEEEKRKAGRGVKTSELFEKNMALESNNHKLHRKVERLMKEIDDLKKPGRKDKENVGSPMVVKGTQSPGPLKDKN